ncbi:hypothetical protein [uncultured Novosphingobium sp.]|uniref:hypothetical protein n=1 Tax=uncultured Novosphingobium sp. TaxID=292277 RepID=UPI0025949873|nr:hypothetical protein [uncultured Novosphingobium sp.]
MNDENSDGAALENRKYITALVFLGLLLLGPIKPYGLTFRLIYLAAAPAAVWYFLGLVGKSLAIDRDTHDRINRAITATIGGAFAVAAYFSFTAPTHSQCTQYVRDRDGGQECVGDSVTVKGPDFTGGFMCIMAAGFAFWFAVAPRSK